MIIKSMAVTNLFVKNTPPLAVIIMARLCHIVVKQLPSEISLSNNELRIQTNLFILIPYRVMCTM